MMRPTSPRKLVLLTTMALRTSAGLQHHACAAVHCRRAPHRTAGPWLTDSRRTSKNDLVQQLEASTEAVDKLLGTDQRRPLTVSVPGEAVPPDGFVWSEVCHAGQLWATQFWGAV